MKQTIFNNWNFMRVVRLVLGLVILIQAFIAKDILFGIAGILFTSMAVFNVGCCSAGACYTMAKKDVEPSKDITYEEVV